MEEKTKTSVFENIKIIDETDDYLVIDKPAGLIVHGGNPSIKEKTLTDWLINRYPQINTVGEDPARPGIVHRLDREVSGLMVIAKNQRSFLNLKNQFKSRLTKKEYHAVVYGRMTPDFGTINFPIARSRAGHKMAALPKIDKKKDVLNDRDLGNLAALNKSREAITDFETITATSAYSLLKVDIKTGRTHQIRVHLAAAGHPILGDNLYASKDSAKKNQKKKYNRIMLASTRLTFRDINGLKKEYTINIPKELLMPFPNLQNSLSFDA